MTRAVRLSGLSRSFKGAGGEVVAVSDLDLDVEAGSLLTLLGPSGCGKSTTLRMVAGLERPDSGRIEVGGRVLFDESLGIDVPANRRGIGMVFQSLALWPHLTAAGNIGYPLRVAGVPRDARRARVDELLQIVDLMGLGDRRPGTLSGGQQQRVAIARALAHEPDLLLLDEPFSALDAGLRRQLGEELKRIQQRLGVTIIYVTHDRREALLLSDSIGMMAKGRMLQHGDPEEVYRRPVSALAAGMLGDINVVKGRVVSSAEGRAIVDTAFGRIEGHVGEQKDLLEPRNDVVVLIRPESLTLLPEPDPEYGGYSSSKDECEVGATRPSVGTLAERSFRGAAWVCSIEVDEQRLTVRTTTPPQAALGELVRLALVPGSDPVVVWNSG